MPYTPWFPEPGSYIKYFDSEKKEYRYRRLLWRRDPLKYPFRLPALTTGTKGNPIALGDINPSQSKKHIYLAYIGVKPGFLYYLWHPMDVKTMKWDETPDDINDDLQANLTYDESPYDYPTKAIGIEHDRYPSVQAKNVSGETKTPEIAVIAALYVVREHTDLTPDELARLEAGALRSYPWDFGGEL